MVLLAKKTFVVGMSEPISNSDLEYFADQVNELISDLETLFNERILNIENNSGRGIALRTKID